MPWLGRWERADPIGLGDGLNRWAYVDGSPMTFQDSSGLGKVRSVAEVVKVLIREGHQVGGRAIRNSALKGRDVTTQVLRDRPGASMSDKFLERLSRLDERFPELTVPYDDAGVPDFSMARHAGDDPVVYDVVDIGAFEGKAAQRRELETAWKNLAEREGLEPQEIDALKERYTPHHTLDIDKGRIEFVDKEIHIAFQHTGGSAVSEFLTKTTALVGTVGAALLPQTAEALEGPFAESPIAATDALVNALAIDLVLLLTPAGDVKDAADAARWLASEEGQEFMREVLREGTEWVRDPTQRAPDGTRLDPETNELIMGPGFKG